MKYGPLEVNIVYNDKKKLVILFFMSLFLSLVETVGIAAIMPFISMASNPELILENKYYNFIYNIYNFNHKV